MDNCLSRHRSYWGGKAVSLGVGADSAKLLSLIYCQCQKLGMGQLYSILSKHFDVDSAVARAKAGVFERLTENGSRMYMAMQGAMSGKFLKFLCSGDNETLRQIHSIFSALTDYRLRLLVMLKV